MPLGWSSLHRAEEPRCQSERAPFAEARRQEDVILVVFLIGNTALLTRAPEPRSPAAAAASRVLPPRPAAASPARAQTAAAAGPWRVRRAQSKATPAAAVAIAAAETAAAGADCAAGTHPAGHRRLVCWAAAAQSSARSPGLLVVVVCILRRPRGAAHALAGGHEGDGLRVVGLAGFALPPAPPTAALFLVAGPREDAVQLVVPGLLPPLLLAPAVTAVS